jgi:hypothetical protein
MDRYRDSFIASNIRICFDIQSSERGVKFIQGSGRERETESPRARDMTLSILQEGSSGVGKKCRG